MKIESKFSSNKIRQLINTRIILPAFLRPSPVSAPTSPTAPAWGKLFQGHPKLILPLHQVLHRVIIDVSNSAHSLQLILFPVVFGGYQAQGDNARKTSNAKFVVCHLWYFNREVEMLQPSLQASRTENQEEPIWIRRHCLWKLEAKPLSCPDRTAELSHRTSLKHCHLKSGSSSFHFIYCCQLTFAFRYLGGRIGLRGKTKEWFSKRQDLCCSYKIGWQHLLLAFRI